MNKREKKDFASFAIFFAMCIAVMGFIVVDVWTSPDPVAHVTNEVTEIATIPIDFRSR